MRGEREGGGEAPEKGREGERKKRRRGEERWRKRLEYGYGEWSLDRENK